MGISNNGHDVEEVTFDWVDFHNGLAPMFDAWDEAREPIIEIRSKLGVHINIRDTATEDVAYVSALVEVVDDVLQRLHAMVNLHDPCGA